MNILAPYLTFQKTRRVHWFAYPDSRGLDAHRIPSEHVAETSKCLLLYKASAFQQEVRAGVLCTQPIMGVPMEVPRVGALTTVL